MEEQFYLFWPLMVFCLNRRGIFIVSAGMWLCSQIAVVAIYHWSTPPFILIWTNTFDNLQYFAIGAILSVVLHGRTLKMPQVWRLALGVAAVFSFIGCAPLLFGHTVVPAYDATLGFMLGGAAAGLLFLSFYGAMMPKLMAGLSYLGQISYGLYVFHVWVLLWVGGALSVLHLPGSVAYPLKIVLSIAFDICLAHLSYQLFESPFLKLKSRFEFVKSRAV